MFRFLNLWQYFLVVEDSTKQFTRIPQLRCKLTRRLKCKERDLHNFGLQIIKRRRGLDSPSFAQQYKQPGVSFQKDVMPGFKPHVSPLKLGAATLWAPPSYHKMQVWDKWASVNPKVLIFVQRANKGSPD